MPRTIDLDDIQSLSVDERLDVIEEIWDSIDDEPSPPMISDELKLELDLRLAAHHRNPNEGSTWAEVKAGLRGLT